MSSPNRNKPKKLTPKNTNTSTKSKDSGFIEFAKKPWVVISTIVIALFGGIPGIITTVSVLNQKPDIKFSIGHINSGYFHNKHGDWIGYFLFYATIYNAGNKSLVPKEFEAYIKYDGRVTKLYPNKMADNINATSLDKTQVVRIRNAANKDLQYLKKLSPDEQYGGYLSFVTTTEIRRDFFRAVKKEYQVVCTDYFGKEYNSGWKVMVDDNSGQLPIGDSVIFPKEDMTIQNK